MTLDKIGLDVAVRVVGFAGAEEADTTRLSSLGLRPGVSVTKILRLPLRDPVECLVGTQLFAVETRLLPLIRVENA